MAEKGLTVPQMKAASGHHSETVLQGYIDSSEAIHRVAASALDSGVVNEVSFSSPPLPSSSIASPPAFSTTTAAKGSSSSVQRTSSSGAQVQYVISLNFSA
jgi:hypothetical protein